MHRSAKCSSDSSDPSPFPSKQSKKSNIITAYSLWAQPLLQANCLLLSSAPCHTRSYMSKNIITKDSVHTQAHSHTQNTTFLSPAEHIEQSEGDEAGEQARQNVYCRKWLWIVSSIVLIDRKDLSVRPPHTHTHSHMHTAALCVLVHACALTITVLYM